MRIQGKFKTGVVFVALLVAGAVSVAGAEADPPSTTGVRAEIVFENGGRIVSIDSDGSNRRILTGSERRPMVRDPLGWPGRVNDSEPAISPDGESLAFFRDVSARKSQGYSTVRRLMVAKRDGSAARSIFVTRGHITDLAWLPDGTGLAFARHAHWWSGNGEVSLRSRTLFRSIPVGGGPGKTLFERDLKPTDFKSYRRYLSAGFLDFRLSPDGSRLAHIAADVNGRRLTVTDLASGRSHTVARGIVDLAWDPSGDGLAFVEKYRLPKRGCGDRCDRHRIVLVGEDGTGRRVIAEGISAWGIEFSPDGSHIAFMSDRNHPKASSIANEIYSVKVTGEACLTWLTNGSPASETPSWGPERDVEFAPSVCGSAGRRALVEIVPRKSQRRSGGPVLWAGGEIRGALLREAVAMPGGERYVYDDCAFFEPKNCLAAFVVESYPVCSSVRDFHLMSGAFKGYSKARGALQLNFGRGRDRGLILATGTSHVYVGKWMFGPGGRPLTRGDLGAIVKSLRSLSASGPSAGRLPRAKIKRSVKRRMSRVERTVSRTGSIAAAAIELGLPERIVRRDLREFRMVERLGPFGTYSCPAH